MTCNECELNDVRKELKRRKTELKRLQLLKAVLAKEKEKNYIVLSTKTTPLNGVNFS